MRISDWSSDVCSSDLLAIVVAFIVLSILRWRAAMIATGKAAERMFQLAEEADARKRMDKAGADARADGASRSEERRVGKERVRTCRSRWTPDHYKKTTRNIEETKHTTENQKQD